MDLEPEALFLLNKSIDHRFNVKLNMADSPDPSAWTTPFQLTKTIHREKIPYALSDSNPQNDQTGKIVVITGGGTGIGAVSTGVALLQSLS